MRTPSLPIPLRRTQNKRTRSPHNLHGFTLVELLVVITILVILISLLLPAMEKAVYQAELAQCAATQKTLGTIMQTYALNQKRVYPSNAERRHTLGKYQPEIIGQKSDPTRDLRPILFPSYVPSYKLLLCPLSGGVGIDLSMEANDPTTKVFANFFLFAGWQYPGAFGGKGMLRLGDRLGFTDKVTSEKIESPVMLMDFYATSLTFAPDTPFSAQSSHPSRLVEMRQKVRNNQLVSDTDPLGDKATYAIWIGSGSPKIDINATYMDGAVLRFNDAKRWDPRFRGAQLQADYTIDQSQEAYIPAR